jgi:thiamine-phosphate pyrophosphorylase
MNATTEPGRLRPLCLISDAARVGEARFLEALAGAARGGLRMVMVREPGWDVDRARALVLSAREVIDRLALDGCLLLIGRRPALAVELGLDGVHVGGGDPEDVSRARALAGPRLLIGYSAHSLEELAAAAARGADYATYSPVFGAISKAHPLPPVGIAGLEAACRRSPIPVYALGGVTPDHAAAVRGAGAAGAAMIGAILDAPDPAVSARAFLAGWEAARPGAA